MVAPPRPNSRCIIVCEQVIADPKNPRRLSLMRIINALRPLAGDTYPVSPPELSVFVQLTECRGIGLLRVEIRDADTDYVVLKSPTQVVTAPKNPLEVCGVVFRTRKCLFPKPGLYQVQLLYDDTVIAETPIILRPASPPAALRGDN